jgi:hypothetical protein
MKKGNEEHNDGIELTKKDNESGENEESAI